MRRTTQALCVLAVAIAMAAPALAVLGDPQLVSLDDAGGDRSGAVLGSAISADGRWVAFTSTDDLTGAATAGILQLYVRDRLNGRTTLASANANGIAADAAVDDPTDQRGYAISGDGRYVAFTTAATNLAAEVDGVTRDVFRKDLVTGAVELVSSGVGGAAANASVSGDPDISFDGGKVVYGTGPATNIWPGDAATSNDLIVRDLASGTTTLASADAAGVALAGTIRRPAISADGRSVAFEDDGVVTVRDLIARTTTVGPSGLFPDLSADGHVVAFQSGVSIVRRDLVAATSSIIANGTLPGLSADGRRVVFEAADDLAPGDTNGLPDVYAGGPAGVLERVSQRGNGSQIARSSDRPAVSGDGAAVAFGFDDGGPGQSLALSDADGSPDILAADLTPTDTTGPALTVTGPVDGASIAPPTVAVTGLATDPSGVMAVSVNGFRAVLGPEGGFDLQVPLTPGTGALTVRAVDGAGKVTERALAVTRSGSSAVATAVRARARALRILRAGRATRVRFALDVGATRVTVRLWRAVPQPGQAPKWTPVTRLRSVGAKAGLRTAAVSPRPLRAGIYQVRISVVSPGGVTVSALRYGVAPRT